MNLTIDSATCGLLVVDMQLYFTRQDYPFAAAAEKIVNGGTGPYFTRINDIVIPNIITLQELFRTAGAPIMYTEFGSHLLDGSDLPGWARRSNTFSMDTVGEPMFPPLVDPSARVDDRLSPRSGEPIFQKTTSGTVAASSIDHNLRARGIHRVYIAGVVTDYCVTQTARELADRDFDVCIVEDACASSIHELHDAALAIFAGAYGWVHATSEITAENTANVG